MMPDGTNKTLLLTILLAVVFAASGCGESKEDKALASVCASRADIQKQVKTLKGLTISTATSDQIKQSLTAIRNDLSSIQGQIPALKDSVKPQVQEATDEFKVELSAIAVKLGKSLSLKDGSTLAKLSLTQLVSAYQQAFGSLQCP